MRRDKKNKKDKNLIGKLEVHKGGFAFLVSEDGSFDDVFIKRNDLLDAMNKDLVEVKILPNSTGRRKEGKVVKVLERACTQLVGVFQKNRGFGFVVPDDNSIKYDVYVAKADQNKAKDGQKVVVKITKWPKKGLNLEGKITEIIGYPGDKGVDILSIIREHDLPDDFPESVWQSVKKIPSKINGDDFPERDDLRHKMIITIDGEDAKDLDDGVSLEMNEEGNYLLGVHIADVGYYVPEGSALDKEAFQRGTSVYLVDRVIPMLPPELSNGICSLNAGEDRLAMSVIMEIDKKGNVINSVIRDTVIRVYRRMTYTAVKALLEGEDKALLEKHQDILPMVEGMGKLSQMLRTKRFRNGSVDFDLPEVKVILDKDGKPAELKVRERSVAEQLIEEFMLLANMTVAETIFWQEMPFLYRVHESPDKEKINNLKLLLHSLGYTPHRLEKGESEAYQKILDEVKGKPEERIVSAIVLRCMQRARYCADSLGHFGLSAKYYSHFTSPIRRYPDLVIHRLIREYQTKGYISDARREQLEKRMVLIAEQSSTRERVAERAERDTVEMKKAEYMLGEIGNVFHGVISGVTAFGLFVELDNLVEGLVHISNLWDDYYYHDEEHYCLLGEETGRRFRLGDEVMVKVMDVNVLEHNIDLELTKEQFGF